MKRFCAALIVICLAALPLLAAPNGPWEIIRADYGSGNNWVDVTDQVRSLVQNDSLNFTVNGNALGAESRRGRNRALRLQLQDNDGNNRQVTYRENQQVTLRVNNTYQGRLHINRAMYGRDNRVSDVTSRLNSQIQGDQLNLVVNNQNMGGDPAPNQVKILTVQYAINGQANQVVLNEGETLRLPYSNNNYGNLHINRATYGRDNRTRDVTSRLNSEIQGDQLNLLVNNQNMGGDPAPDQVKTLTVQYAINGQNNQVVLNEGDTLQLPYGTGNESSQRIRCESLQSNGYGRKYCTADTRGGVRLTRNLGNSECIQGSSWGNDDRGIWVDRGCRAEFERLQYDGSPSTATSNPYPYGTGGELIQRFRCESLQSDNYGRKYCPADTRGGIRLTRNLGNSDCSQGASWGNDDRGVWVDKGCRAEFERLQDNFPGTTTSATIPNGTALSVRTNELIDSKTTSVGQTYSAVIAEDVLDGSGRVIIPKGSDTQLVIRSTNGGGITSASDLVLDVDSITVGGTKYFVSTDDLERKGGQGVGANSKTAIFVGGGAALGTLIGAIAGGGKGAAIGAAIGAGAGLGTQVLTKGKQVRVPAETLLNFKIDQDVRLQAMR